MFVMKQWPRIVSLLGLAAMIIVSTWAMDESNSPATRPSGDSTVIAASKKIPPLDEMAAKIKTKTATFALG